MRRYTEQDLIRYDELVAEAEEIIRELEALIPELERHGVSAAIPKGSLKFTEEMLQLWDDERLRILSALTKMPAWR